MNRSFQGLLILGPVPRGLCIHEGQERHHEVTGGDSVKVTSSCRPLVLSQQAASSRAPVPPPHHSLKTSPCCGERPLGPSPWPSLDTSSATGTSVRKDTTAGFPRLPPPAPDHLVASPQRPAALSTIGPPYSLPSQPGGVQSSQDHPAYWHTGVALGSFGAVSTPPGTRAWRAPRVFSTVCCAAALLFTAAQGV